MDIKIENQIKELVKKIEGPLNELNDLMDEFWAMERELDCPENITSYYELECNYDYLSSYKDELEKVVSTLLQQITVLSNEDIYDDPAGYLEPFMKIHGYMDEIIGDLF